MRSPVAYKSDEAPTQQDLRLYNRLLCAPSIDQLIKWYGNTSLSRPKDDLSEGLDHTESGVFLVDETDLKEHHKLSKSGLDPSDGV
jgi:hypothetical protein